jgi:hypothetical protein
MTSPDRPTGLRITHEETFVLEEMFDGNWLVKIKTTTNGSAEMVIKKENMPYIRDMLVRAIKGNAGGENPSSSANQ